MIIFESFLIIFASVSIWYIHCHFGYLNMSFTSLLELKFKKKVFGWWGVNNQVWHLLAE